MFSQKEKHCTAPTPQPQKKYQYDTMILLGLSNTTLIARDLRYSSTPWEMDADFVATT